MATNQERADRDDVDPRTGQRTRPPQDLEMQRVADEAVERERRKADPEPAEPDTKEAGD